MNSFPDHTPYQQGKCLANIKQHPVFMGLDSKLPIKFNACDI